MCLSVCLSVCVSKKKNADGKKMLTEMWNADGKKNADGNVEQLFKFLNSLLNFLKKCLWSTET